MVVINLSRKNSWLIDILNRPIFRRLSSVIESAGFSPALCRSSKESQPAGPIRAKKILPVPTLKYGICTRELEDQKKLHLMSSDIRNLFSFIFLSALVCVCIFHFLFVYLLLRSYCSFVLFFSFFLFSTYTVALS